MSQMRCRVCGGVCEWRNLGMNLASAHTVCLKCGAQNTHEDQPQQQEEEEEDDG